MIELYVGAPGSGKSFHALVRGWSKVHYFKRNHVIANFPIRFPKRDIRRGIDKRWIYVEDRELTPEFLITESVKRGWYGDESSCLLIIDEAGIFFNARDWQVQGERRKNWIKFFSQSRKFGYDIIMVAQDPRMIDRQIRSMAEFTVKHVKMRNYIWLKWLPWQLFAVVSYWAGGSFRGSLSILPFRPFLARRYDSMRMFDIRIEGLNLNQ